MPVDERAPRTTERCSLHPGSPAVARCEGCGRSMCLSCAVPVRGAAYGPECLAQVLGEEPGDAREAEPRRTRIAVIAGFGLALATTGMPWTTFGEGSSLFGAWGRSPRWALLSAIAALLGLVVAALANRRTRPGPRWDVAMLVLGAAVSAGAVLEWFRPPFPSRPSVVPWIAAAAGAFCAISALRRLRDDERAGG